MEQRVYKNQKMADQNTTQQANNDINIDLS
jgi:hypothetical protein